MNRFYIRKGGGSVLLNQRNMIRKGEKGGGEQKCTEKHRFPFSLSWELWKETCLTALRKFFKKYSKRVLGANYSKGA